MIELVGCLIMVCMMMLLGMMRMVILVLELGHLHGKSLMSLRAVQHGGMLSLVSLAVHVVGI